MLASKLKISLGISLFSTPTTITTASAAHFPIRSAFPLKQLRLNRRLRSSYAVDEITESIDIQRREEEEEQHPWREWINFVDRLKSGGYLIEKSSDVAGNNDVSVYKDLNQLKEACLRFGRDRYDVFKSLSEGDIRTVVGGGCPNLLRKVVNSAKRLRAHFQINEGDVCSSCHLRSSCDRAYVILKDDEVDASTVDIVRVLLYHAIDPVVLSQDDKPPGRELFEDAIRKLLSELIEFSNKAPTLAPQKPTTKVISPKVRDVNLSNNKLPTDVEMKRGDWMCPKCSYINYSRNVECRKCKEDRPKQVGANNIEMKDGDWVCSECDFVNFARNVKCRKCKEEKPKRVSVEMKRGDWNCPSCGFMNFASNKSCLKCQDRRPKTELSPGEWECPSCDFLNFSRNEVCLKCNHERPAEAALDIDDRIWRRPRSPTPETH